MADKLDEIMAWKRREIAGLVASLAATEGDLARIDAELPKPPSFEQALRRTDGALAIIAEIKRKSPSAGDIAAGASAPDQARKYAAAQVDALSILTDQHFFGGALADLRAVTDQFARETRVRPCLRKDFFVHPVQVREAREAGAAAILIIVRALKDEEIKVLFGAAQAAGLQALFEIHNEMDLARAVAYQARIIGVNNRDLAIFKTDLGLSERLIPQIPQELVAVSESGILTGADARRVQAVGARAVLVGEALMRASDPAVLAAQLRGPAR